MDTDYGLALKAIRDNDQASHEQWYQHILVQGPGAFYRRGSRDFCWGLHDTSL